MQVWISLVPFQGGELFYQTKNNNIFVSRNKNAKNFKHLDYGQIT